MIIEKIRIECFGNLENREFELCEGVNIIEGANESGKSTLAAFIKFIFYGLSSKAKDSELSERERYVSWSTGSAGGSIVLRVGENRYRVDRAIMSSGQTSENGEKKVTYREGVGIVDLSNNSPVKVKETPGEYFFGVDADVFARTAFVSQLDGARIDGEKMTQAIENILFSADENVNVQKAIKKLEASRVALLHKNAKGGKIYEFEATCAELEAKLEGARRINADILVKESSLEDAQTRLVEIEKRRKQLAGGIKAFENATVLTLFDRLRTLMQMSEEYKKKENEFCARYEKDGFVPDREYIGLLYEKSEARKSAGDQLESVRARLNEAETAVDEIVRGVPSELAEIEDWSADEQLSFRGEGVKRTLTLLGIVFGALALVMLGVGAFAKFKFALADIGLTVMLAAAFPTALSALMFILLGVRAKGLKKLYAKYGAARRADFEAALTTLKIAREKKAAADEALTQVRAELDAAERAYKRADGEFYDLAQRWNNENDLATVIKAAEEVVAELDKIRSDSSKTSEMISMLTVQLSPYDEEALRAESAEQTSADEVNAENVAEKRREYDFLTAQAKANETKIHELEKELAALRPQCENPARIAEKISLVKAYIEEYSKKHAAYVLAAEKILEAGDGMRENVSPKLAEYTCKLMGGVTEGKYREIGVDSELNVSVNAGGATRRLDYLSAGTQDAAYVSLRLALINTLFRKTAPTVIFDESFSRLDADRLGGMMRLTNALAEGGMQSVVLTSGPREAEAMKDIGEFNVITFDRAQV